MGEIWRNMKEKWRNMKDKGRNMKEIRRNMKEIWRNMKEIWRKYEGICRKYEEMWRNTQFLGWPPVPNGKAGLPPLWRNYGEIWRSIKKYEEIMKKYAPFYMGRGTPPGAHEVWWEVEFARCCAKKSWWMNDNKFWGRKQGKWRGQWF